MTGRAFVRFALSITLFALAFSCRAEETSPSGAAMFGSEETVSIATGRRQSIRTAPAVATVITAEDIRNYGFRNVTEALALVPGFHVGYGIALTPYITVRGFSDFGSANTLFLLDGVAVDEIETGNRSLTLGTIPLDMIERIEVTRGPGSAVFGAEAFSAVVNVITKREVLDQQLTISAGSYDTRNARLLLGVGDEDGKVVIGAEANTTDGWSPYIREDRWTATDRSLGTSSSFAPSHANTGRDEVAAMVKASYGRTRGFVRFSRWTDMGTGTGLAGSLDPTGRTSVKTVQLRASHDFRLSDDLSLSVLGDVSKYTLNMDKARWFPPSPYFPNGALIDATDEHTDLKLHVDGRYDGLETHSIAFGLGYDQDHYKIEDIDLNYAVTDRGAIPAIPGLIEPDHPDTDSTRRVIYGYLQDEWYFAPTWTLTVGARVDDYSDVGTQFSPRAALVWTPTPQWTAKLLYGEGFRAPVVVETQYVGAPAYRPNEDLDPQRLRTVDLFFGYNPAPQINLGLNVFYHRTVDQIRQQNLPNFIEPQNVGDQEGRGVEVEGSWTINDHWSFRGWYAYQYNIDKTTNKNAGYSPQHRAFTALQYRRNKWFFNLSSTIVGDRARVAEDTRKQPDKYFRVNLLGRYEVNRHFAVQMDIRNLLNSSDKEPSAGTVFPVDYPLPERNYYASLEMRF